MSKEYALINHPICKAHWVTDRLLVDEIEEWASMDAGEKATRVAASLASRDPGHAFGCVTVCGATLRHRAIPEILAVVVARQVLRRGESGKTAKNMWTLLAGPLVIHATDDEIRDQWRPVPTPEP